MDKIVGDGSAATRQDLHGGRLIWLLHYLDSLVDIRIYKTWRPTLLHRAIDGGDLLSAPLRIRSLRTLVQWYLVCPDISSCRRTATHEEMNTR